MDVLVSPTLRDWTKTLISSIDFQTRNYRRVIQSMVLVVVPPPASRGNALRSLAFALISNKTRK